MVAPARGDVPLMLAGLVSFGALSVPAALCSRGVQILIALGGAALLVQGALYLWDRLPEGRRKTLEDSWALPLDRVFEARGLGLWPVSLVLLTSLLGISDWFPPKGPDRPILLAAITVVACYGYGRSQAEKRQDLLAFTNRTKDEFTQAAKQIHLERDRQVEINRIVKDFLDSFSELKKDSAALGVPFRELVDIEVLKDECLNLGFRPIEFQRLLRELGIEQ